MDKKLIWGLMVITIGSVTIKLFRLIIILLIKKPLIPLYFNKGLINTKDVEIINVSPNAYELI